MTRSAVLVLLGFLVWGISWFVSPHEALTAQSALAKPMAEVMGNLQKSIDALPPASGHDATVATVRTEPTVTTTVSTPRSSSKTSGGEWLFEAKGPPGWRAFRASWDLLTGDAAGDDSVVKVKVLGATGLTNAVMALAVLVGLFRLGGSRARAFGLALLACAALDLSWFYLNDASFRSGLEVGYWMWAGSFVLAGFGFIFREESAR